ncbi:MAG: hypothetical protein AABW48_01770 [Nanoarchaeota archaeon]
MDKKNKEISLCEVIKYVFMGLFKMSKTEPQEQIPIYVSKDKWGYTYYLGGPGCGMHYPLTMAEKFYGQVADEMVEKQTKVLINKPFDDSYKPLSVDEMALLYAKIATKHQS